ncbi:protein rep, partial [Streptococcus thermophilus]
MLVFLESKSLITKMIIPITNTIHVLMMVRPSYFQSKKDYITQKEWGNLWSQSLKVDYAPVVDVGTVKE